MTSPQPPELERLARSDDSQLIPEAVSGQTGLFVVDATWGTITPMTLAAGIETVGELEVIDHIERGLPLVDTRKAHFFGAGTIPTAINAPHDEFADAIASFDRDVATVFFCNGPQCAATPAAIEKLLKSGYPASAIHFYRGGIHDWVTLGLPTTA